MGAGPLGEYSPGGGWPLRRWRVLAVVDARVKAPMALLAVLALVVPPLALFRDVIGVKAALAVAAASFALFYLAFDRLAASLLAGAAHVVRAIGSAGEAVGGALDDEGDDVSDEYLDALDMVMDEDSEERLVPLWGLASSLYREMGGKKDVLIIVYDGEDGVPIYYYPEYLVGESEALEADAGGGPQAIPGDTVLTVMVDVVTFAALAPALERGQDEALVVSTRRELEALYSLAKAIAASVVPEEMKGLAPYLAYKAIVKLQRRGLIRYTDPSLPELLPLEDQKTRALVREQLREEIGASTGNQ